jgi:hypothetical protein
VDRCKQARSGGDGGIPNNRHSRHAGRNLFEQLQPFPTHAKFVSSKTGSVAARPRQAGDPAAADRIDHRYEYDRHGAARLLQRPHGCTSCGQDDIRRDGNQFCRVTNAVGIAHGPAVIDPHIAAIHPPQLLEALLERCDTGLAFQIAFGEGQQNTNPPHLLGTRR